MISGSPLDRKHGGEKGEKKNSKYMLPMISGGLYKNPIAISSFGICFKSPDQGSGSADVRVDVKSTCRAVPL